MTRLFRIFKGKKQPERLYAWRLSSYRRYAARPRLPQILNQVVHMLDPHAESNHVSEIPSDFRIAAGTLACVMIAG